MNTTDTSDTQAWYLFLILAVVLAALLIPIGISHILTFIKWFGEWREQRRVKRETIDFVREQTEQLIGKGVTSVHITIRPLVKVQAGRGEQWEKIIASYRVRTCRVCDITYETNGVFCQYCGTSLIVEKPEKRQYVPIQPPRPVEEVLLDVDALMVFRDQYGEHMEMPGMNWGTATRLYLASLERQALAAEEGGDDDGDGDN